MEIIRADRSGFCFGVQRAIDLTMEQIEKNEKGEKRPLYTCGPLIHNRSVTGALEENRNRSIARRRRRGFPWWTPPVFL